MKWVKHDTDANQDAKLQNVLLDYGLEGYGLYWYCIELIAGKVDKENITFELEHDARIIARNTGSSAQKISEIMKYFVDQGLFENTSGVVTCLKLARRLDKSMTSNPDMREIIGKLKNHDGVMTKSENVMQEETRLEETRLEEIKDMPPQQVETPLPKVPYSKILDLYHSTLPNHPQIKVLSEKRKAHIRQTWRNYLNTLDDWEEYFRVGVSKNDFLSGKSVSINGRKPWMADFDWLINQNNAIKVSEGKYNEQV